MITLEELSQELLAGVEQCKQLPIDLSLMEFFADDDGTMMLRRPSDQDALYYFKADLSSGRDPLVAHAQKQFCRVVGVPHSYFRKNRPAMRNRMVRGWQQSLETDSPSAVRLLKYRKSSECNVVRALVGRDHTDLRNHQVVESVMGTPDIPVDLHLVSGEDMDSLVFHFRVLVGDPFEIEGDRVRMGAAFTCSELGASEFIVDSYVHHLESDVSFFGTYGSAPYFVSRYESIREDELRNTLPSFIKSIAEQYSTYKETIEALDGFQGVQESCRIVGGNKKCSPALRRAIYQEASEYSEDMRSFWDFARHVSLVGHDLDTQKRIKAELVAGTFLNLVFERTERSMQSNGS